MSTIDNQADVEAEPAPSEDELFLRDLLPGDTMTRRRTFSLLLRNLVEDNGGSR